MKYFLMYLILVLLSACSSGSSTPVQASQNAYYLDAQSGSDSNNGTSSDTPWQSFANIATTNFADNVTVYLKRGSTWYEQLTIPTSNFNIDAYGSGALPIIDGSMSVTGWSNPATDIYSSAVTVNSGEALGNVSEEGVMMTFAAWDNDFATSLASATTGSYTYNWATNTIYIKVATDPALKSYRTSIKIYGINVDGKSNISVKNVSIKRFSLAGANFKNCATCSITDATISEGGGAVLFSLGIGSSPDYLYAGNGVEFGNSASNGTASNLTISKIFDSGLSPQTYSSNQTAGPFTFSDITISECGFAGIEISVLDNSGTSNSSINTVSMSNITISNSGKGWSDQRYGTEGYGIRVKADTGAGTISNVSLTTSEITGSVNSGIKLAGESNVVNITRSKFHTNDSHGIDVSEASATSLRLDIASSLIYNNGGYGIAYNSTTAAGFNILHNTFYNNTTINLSVTNQVGVANIRNNIFHSSAAMTHIYVDSTLTGATLNNNCYQDQTNMFGYNSSAYSTVAAFNTDYASFESAGTGAGTIGLADPGAGNFTISVGSSCDGLGDATVGIASDYSANSYANPPASGAYEAQ